MDNIYKQKLTGLQQSILRFLFTRAGEQPNQRTIAKGLGVSATAIMKALPEIENLGFISIKKDKESKRLAICLNRENHFVMQLKRVDNLKLIYESGLADFLEKEFAGGTIILFGSYSRGEDTINSDIDIAIIGRKEKNTDTEKFEKVLNRKININFYSSFKGIHKNLKENLFNGIMLCGGVAL